MSAEDNTPERPLVPGVPGRPFAKGQSGNPGGMPKEIAAVRRQLLEHVPTALAKMVELIGHEDANVARAAAKDILDRTMGKAKETREHTGDANALLVEILTSIRDAKK